MKRKKGLTRLYQTFAFLMVQMTGFDSRRTTPAVIRGSNSHLGCYSLPLLLQTHHPHKQKRHNHKGCTSFVGADDGIWTHTSLNTGTWNQRVCRSATSAWFLTSFLLGEDSEAVPISDKSYIQQIPHKFAPFSRKSKGYYTIVISKSQSKNERFFPFFENKWKSSKKVLKNLLTNGKICSIM